ATLSTITSLHARGVDTFVVGFNSVGGIDVPALNSFAVAGGQPADGGLAFYNAQDQAGLQAVLDTIGGRSMSCSYALGTAPPDPTKLFVFFDQVLVTTGWSYDGAANQIV